MSATPFFLDVKSKTPAGARRFKMQWTQRARHIIQFAFAAYILYMAVAHNLATEDGAVASIDALCPFGGIETLWRVQDLMNWIRAKLHLREIIVPNRLDKILRYGRFVVLAMVLYQTISTVKLWFADWDPYRTLFGLGWLFEFDLTTSWFAYAVVIVVLVSSLFIERAWCRYACPLGGIIALVGKLSFMRIRRTETGCKGCNVCETPCPVKLPVATVKTVSSDCIGCLACVQACPKHDTLDVKLAPTWLPSK
ncbi:MAG: 4Fe-4S binding protein [Chloroflexi bacterium]|nr:4Fe-4S binding protein [Chloroflexota bacterium]